MSTAGLDQALDGLRQWCRRQERLAVAWSGGADSTLLVAVAHGELADRCLALHFHTPLHTRDELAHLQGLAKALGVTPLILEADPLAWPEFVTNPPDRCYLCKKHLYALCRRAAPEHLLADGTNRDDLSDDRPGLRALAEDGVATPLAACGFTKAMVRTASRELGLVTWDRPANSCLATRIPTGLPITRDQLATVAAAETLLADRGWPGCRVRLAGDRAILEVAAGQVEDLWQAIRRTDLAEHLQRLGIRRAAVDGQGR